MVDRAAFMEKSRELARELGQSSWLDAPASVPADADFIVRSRTRRETTYPMVYTPEGYAVHQGLGCEGEVFNGVLGCWHAREYARGDAMTTALTTRDESLIPSRIDFTNEQLSSIAKVICVDSDGHEAPPAFTEIFIATCRHSGLNPFLKQIYALKVKGKWTMYVGIDGYRVISERTGLDQGMDGPQWSDDGEKWFDYPMSDRPKFARVGIWRKNVPRPYVAVCKLSAYEQPTSPRWKDDAPGQLAKCAEALARRRAFPADTAVIPQAAALEMDEEIPEISYPDAIEGEVIDHIAGAGKIEHGQAQGTSADESSAARTPPARPVVGDTTQEQGVPSDASPASPSSPDDALSLPGMKAEQETEISEWWAMTRAQKLTRTAVINVASEMFGREPMHCTTEERQQIYDRLIEGKQGVII